MRCKLIIQGTLLLNLLWLVDCQLSDGENTSIDFSDGFVEEDGTICVTREEERESVEASQEQQCTQQNVTQCHDTYVTKYTNAKREKCVDVFVKTCRIVQRPKSYNHTLRMCRTPLVKKCHTYQESLPVYGGGYAAPPPPPHYGYGEPPKTICKDLFETVCNTSVIVGDDGRDKVPITRCGQVQKQICAEDKCKVVEGDPECFEKTVENIVQVPEETCSLEPITECREETVSIPNLVPEEECRVIPKEVCQTVFLNSSPVTKTEVVKYCMNDDGGVVGSSSSSPRQTSGTGNDIGDNVSGRNNNNLLRQVQLQQAQSQLRQRENFRGNDLRSALLYRARVK